MRSLLWVVLFLTFGGQNAWAENGVKLVGKHVVPRVEVPVYKNPSAGSDKPEFMAVPGERYYVGGEQRMTIMGKTDIWISIIRMDVAKLGWAHWGTSENQSDNFELK